MDKQCSKCGQPHANNHSWCNPCRAADSRERRKDPAVAERGRVVAREWQKRNPERHKAINAAYFKTLPGKVTQRNASHRKKFGKQIGKWTVADIEKRYAYQAGRCLGCYQQFDITELQFDLNLPGRRFGQCTYDNLLLLCVSCNASKKELTFAEWTEWRYARNRNTR